MTPIGDKLDEASNVLASINELAGFIMDVRELDGPVVAALFGIQRLALDARALVNSIDRRAV